MRPAPFLLWSTSVPVSPVECAPLRVKLSIRKRIEALATDHLSCAEAFNEDPNGDAATSAAFLQSAAYGLILVETDKGLRMMKKMMKANGMTLDPAPAPPQEPFSNPFASTSAPYEDNGVFGRRNDVDQLAEIGDSVAAIRSLIRNGMIKSAESFASLLEDKYGDTFRIALGEELRADLGIGLDRSDG